MPRASRRNPPREARPQTSEAVLGAVLDELKALRERVDAIEAPTRNLPGSNPDGPNEAGAEQDGQDGLDNPPANYPTATPPTSEASLLPPVQAVDAQALPPAPTQCFLPSSWPPQPPHLPPWPAHESAAQKQPPATMLFTTPPQPSQSSPPVEQLLASGNKVPLASLPQRHVVPRNIKEDIWRGKDVNLAILLLPLRERQLAKNVSTPRAITIGDEVLSLKPFKDSRLTQNLTIQEFMRAFDIFKNIMCERYPQRRIELDQYQTNILEISNRFPAFIFYEYHLDFSAQAAENLLQGHRVDWAIIDESRLSWIIAGRGANACTLCGAFDHTSTFCLLSAGSTSTSKTANSTPDSSGGRPPRGVCRFFNSVAGCRRGAKCNYTHHCSKCDSADHKAIDCRIKSVDKPRTSF